MWTWLIIFGVVAVALAPLTHFMPTKRQRAVASMREYAAVNGLFVEFRKFPGGDERPWPAERPSGDVIYYGKRLPAKGRRDSVSANWRRDKQGWCSVGNYAAVPEYLEELGPEILGASRDDSSCGVYWVESGGESGVEQIRGALQRWSDEIATLVR